MMKRFPVSKEKKKGFDFIKRFKYNMIGQFDIVLFNKKILYKR